MVASFTSSICLVSLGKEKRVCSPMLLSVFITSEVVLWWALGAAGWKRPNRRFYGACCLVAGPGHGPGGLWDRRGQVDTGGRHGGWTELLAAPTQRWLFLDGPFLGFLSQTSSGCSQRGGTGMSSDNRGRRRWWHLPQLFSWAARHLPALSIFPWKK